MNATRTKKTYFVPHDFPKSCLPREKFIPDGWAFRNDMPVGLVCENCLNFTATLTTLDLENGDIQVCLECEHDITHHEDARQDANERIAKANRGDPDVN